MKKEHDMYWAWLDLEMTGLDPKPCVIVEAALIVTDDKLQVLHEGVQALVKQPKDAMDAMSPVVRQMHERSGLLQALESASSTLSDVEHTLCNVLDACNSSGHPFMLCGNSIATDRAFVKAYMPTFEKKLHYRMIDVSTVKVLANAWCSSIAPFVKQETHRALDDIKESIAELAYYKAHAFTGGAC